MNELSYRTHCNISAFPPLATTPDCTLSATNGFKNANISDFFKKQILDAEAILKKKIRTLRDMAVHRVDYNSNSWRRHRKNLGSVSSIGWWW